MYHFHKKPEWDSYKLFFKAKATVCNSFLFICIQNVIYLCFCSAISSKTLCSSVIWNLVWCLFRLNSLINLFSQSSHDSLYQISFIFSNIYVFSRYINWRHSKKSKGCIQSMLFSNNICNPYFTNLESG